MGLNCYISNSKATSRQGCIMLCKPSRQGVRMPHEGTDKEPTDFTKTSVAWPSTDTIKVGNAAVSGRPARTRLREPHEIAGCAKRVDAAGGMKRTSSWAAGTHSGVGCGHNT